MLTELPVQVDGEPWLQPSGQVVVLRSALKVNHLTFVDQIRLADNDNKPVTVYCTLN